MEYIIIENNKSKIDKYKKIINGYIVNYDYEYKIKENNYSKDIAIYIINNIEIARIIRFEKQDWNSIIILITNKKVENNNYLILDIINEFDVKSRLKNTLDLATNIMNINNNYLTYTYKSIIYNININKITYIEKIKESKNIMINTIDNEYICPISMNKIIMELPLCFKKCSRSYIINTKQVLYYYIKDNIIEFYNKKRITEISRNYKKELINYFRMI